ncbi:MAG: hypothetical protein AAGN35_09615 [Bacteroidota bacterium]
MIRAGAIGLVLLYGVAMLRPAGPFLSYRYNYAYIATVLCINRDKPEMRCNGACHLKKMVKETQKSAQHPGRELIRLADYPLAIPPLPRETPVRGADLVRPHPFDRNSTYTAHLQQIFHPPTS